MSDLPSDLKAALQAEIRAGERISWSAQPNPSGLMKSSFALWLFFVPWTAFSLFWMAGASGFEWPSFNKGMDFFPLFGLPFLLIGLGGLSSPWWLHRKALNMVYVITNQRLIEMVVGKKIEVKSYAPEMLSALQKTVNADGSGNIMFASRYYSDSDGDSRIQRMGFYGIPDVRKVELMIEALVKTTVKAKIE